MKNPIKLSLILTTVTALASGTVLADDSASRQQVDLQRQQAKHSRTTTVAAYAQPYSVLGHTAQDRPSEKCSTAPGQAPASRPRSNAAPQAHVSPR